MIVEGGVIQGVVLKAFEDYYGSQPFIEQVAFRYYPDAPATLAAYREGEILGIGQVTDDILPEVLAEPELNLYTARMPQLSLIFLNLDNPETEFLQDPAVRRALMFGLNRSRIVDRLLGGQAIIADGPVFPGTWAYYDGIERLEYDPQQAIDMLKEAGFTIPADGGVVRADEEGNFLRFELIYPQDAGYDRIAEAIQRDWAEIGVEVTLQAVPYDELVTQYLDNRNYAAALVDIDLTQSPDPDPYAFWHQAQVTGGQNYSKWDDLRASEYIEQARITTDIAERTRLYNNFQVRYTQEMPALTLFYPVYNYAVDEEVQGVSVGPLFDPSDRFNTIPQWFLVTKRSLDSESTETETPTVQP
jgi:peptide/nickel transport system substrate-binding protein